MQRLLFRELSWILQISFSKHTVADKAPPYQEHCLGHWSLRSKAPRFDKKAPAPRGRCDPLTSPAGRVFGTRQICQQSPNSERSCLEQGWPTPSKCSLIIFNEKQVCIKTKIILSAVNYHLSNRAHAALWILFSCSFVELHSLALSERASFCQEMYIVWTAFAGSWYLNELLISWKMTGSVFLKWLIWRSDSTIVNIS